MKDNHLKIDGPDPAILFIDDEENILSAIDRSLRSHPFEVFVAFGWETAEPILLKNDIAVVVCDRNLRAAENGIQILERLHVQFPDIVRVMLSGDFEIQTILSAINQGQVHRFISKPWDLNELVKAIDDSIALHTLYRERNEFEKELIELNQTLEKKVQKSTERLTRLYADLEQSFDETIGVLLSIIGLHSALSVDHAKRTAQRVVSLCQLLDVSAKMTGVLKRAALLHWTGLTTVSPAFFESHLWDMAPGQKPVWEFHALLGQQALRPVPTLQLETEVIANYLRPDQAPPKIRFISHVLAASSFFEHALHVVRKGRAKVEKREIEALHSRFSEEYPFLDSVVLEALFASERRKVRGRIESSCNLQSLRKGMVISRPISGTDGILLSGPDTVVDNELIELLKTYPEVSSVYVWDENP